MSYKLGKKDATYDKRDLLFSDFAKKGVTLHAAPVGFGTKRDQGIDWGMLGNDKYGDCVFAGAAHETMYLNHIVGTGVSFTDQAVLSDYSAVTGFDPNDPNTDQGTDMRQALNYRRKTGIVDATGKRHKIAGFVALEPGNWTQHLEALDIFDVVAIGLVVPYYFMDEFDAHKSWTYRKSAANNIAGGHYVPIDARSHIASLDVVTWAREQTITKSALYHFNDESYAFITQESLDHLTGKTVEGYNWTDLQAALTSI